MTTVYHITGMHCGSCVQKVTAALNGLADTVSVTLNPPRVTLQGRKEDDLVALNAAVGSIGGYTLSPLETTDDVAMQVESKSWVRTYYPLLLIVGLIALVSLRGAGGIHDWMLHFMAGFFIVFGFFKLLDLKGFRDAYRGYDLLAQRWDNYGLIYPFIELGLGFMFLFQVHLVLALLLSMIVMAFGSIGVIQAVGG